MFLSEYISPDYARDKALSSAKVQDMILENDEYEDKENESSAMEEALADLE